VDSEQLRPTASREELYEDDLLEETREALGAQLRQWLMRLSNTGPERLGQFLRIHHLGVKAMAVHDGAMLRVIERWWPMETNTGPMTLAQFRSLHPVARYTSTTQEFRELGAVAGAQGIGLINGGYAYDIEIMRRLPELDPRIEVRRLDPGELTTRLEEPDPATRLRTAPFLDLAANVLRPLNCDVLLRGYEPDGVTALYPVGRAAIAAEEMRAARSAAGAPWAGVLSAVDDGQRQERPQLVLNARNPVVAKAMSVPDPHLAALGVQALYGQALLRGTTR
jgi:molecular chaperone HtpG